jgi:nicotinamidase-related amidase
MKTFKELSEKLMQITEAWGSTNPKVPFTGEYEVEFAPNSVTGRSSFYVDHDGGFTDKPGLIYVKTDYKGKGDSNTNEKKFIATLKKHLAAAKKAGERVNVEIHTNEGTNARQRGEIQSPRTPEEYDALSPKDKKIIDKRIKNAKKQGMSANPGESPRNKRTKRKPQNRNRRTEN